MKEPKLNVFRQTGAENFVISRKRKKFRFARFNEFANCFHQAEWREFWQNYSKKFESNKFEPTETILEVGAGSALFLVEQAKLASEQIFVAVDIKGDRLYQGARVALEQGIDNIYFLRSDIASLPELFASHQISQIWLTFSDPYPRKSDAKHRLTHARYLEIYAKVLKQSGVLHFKTDSVGLFDYSQESFGAAGWRLDDVTRDLHGNNKLPPEYKIMTSYERRFVDEGLKIHYFSAYHPSVKNKILKKT